MSRKGMIRVIALAITGWMAFAVVLGVNFLNAPSFAKGTTPISSAGAPVSGPDPQGYYWVLKRAASWGESVGTGTIGQAIIQIRVPGTYTFHYKVTDTDFIYLKQLWVFVFPERVLQERRVITSEDLVAEKVFDFYPGYDAALSFTVTAPGRYRVGFGPYEGVFLFKDAQGAVPNLKRRAHLGLKLTGGDAQIVDLEAAADLRTYKAPSRVVYIQENPQ